MNFLFTVPIFFFMLNILHAASPTEPIVTAEKYMEYKKRNGHLNEFIAPKVVLVCYQQSTLQHLLKTHSEIKLSNSFSHLYLIEDGKVGILGGWGMGAPALAIKVEELIVLGVETFIAVGTAGTLMDNHPIGEFIIASKALAEDGVAHLYLKDRHFAEVDQNLAHSWSNHAQDNGLPHFHEAGTWSFSALFRETPADISRVTRQGYNVVEMEAATLYAIGKEKGVQAISLFVISDALSQENWVPHIKEFNVRNNLHKLSEWALEFCKEVAVKTVPCGADTPDRQ